LGVAEGKPLKNLAVTCAGQRVRGELLVTKYGLEGGALYQLGRWLKMDSSIEIDFKPDLTDEELLKRWRNGSSLQDAASKCWRLSPAAIALIDETMKPSDVNSLLTAVRHCSLRLKQPRPIAEAISSAGGVDWSELDDHLMLRRIPGVFCAGEMIDWDAPTGGYLLQGCYATGKIAGEGAVKWIAQGAEA
jgi:predicted flavoprotein YhiN